MPRLMFALRAAALALALPAALTAQGYPAETGDAVTDLANVIRPAHADSIRQLLGSLRAGHGVDARVVTVRSVRDDGVGATSIEPFATGLFNAWRIDDAGTNDGVLLVVAVDDRAVRVELGDGSRADMDARARTVVDEYILPHFRAGDYSEGIWSGVQGIASSFSGGALGLAAPVQPAYSAPEAGPRDGGFTPEGKAIGFGLAGLAGLGAGLMGWRRYLRHRPRPCPQCGRTMTRLDEHADDAHLERGEQAEERIGSVDYDVWSCGGCGHHQEVPYASWMSGAEKCGGCGYRTVKTHQHTISSPTYTSTGLARRISDCKHCGWHHERDVTLARLQRSSSSSSGGSRGGGGSSSGRGASGSW